MKLLKGLYVFCFIKFDQNVENRQAELPGETYFVIHRDIAAVVSSVPKTSWQPTRKNIQKHQKVISQTQEIFELMPLRFGTVFKDSNEIKKVIDNNYQEMNSLLSKIRGRVELGLRVFWHHEAFLKEVGSQRIERLKREYRTAKKDRYMIALEAGKIVEAKVLQKREEYIREIFEPLSALADDDVLNPVTGEKMVFNGAFLVKKQSVANFDQTVYKLINKYKDKFSFKYSGPWPPYNFVSVSW